MKAMRVLPLMTVTAHACDGCSAVGADDDGDACNTVAAVDDDKSTRVLPLMKTVMRVLPHACAVVAAINDGDITLV